MRAGACWGSGFERYCSSRVFSVLLLSPNQGRELHGHQISVAPRMRQGVYYKGHKETAACLTESSCSDDFLSATVSAPLVAHQLCLLLSLCVLCVLFKVASLISQSHALALRRSARCRCEFALTSARLAASRLALQRVSRWKRLRTFWQKERRERPQPQSKRSGSHRAAASHPFASHSGSITSHVTPSRPRMHAPSSSCARIPSCSRHRKMTFFVECASRQVVGGFC